MNGWKNIRTNVLDTNQPACPALEAETHNKDPFSIPEHEVITRRMQFRMKKEKCKRKKEQKELRQQEKTQKLKEKEEKRQQREDKKKAKSLAASSKTKEKHGRSSAEKAKDWKPDCKDVKKTSKKNQKNVEKVRNDDGDHTPKEVVETHASKEIVPVKSRQMKRLRKQTKMCTKMNNTDDVSKPQEMEEEECEKAGPKKRKTNKKASAEEKGTEEKVVGKKRNQKGETEAKEKKQKTKKDLGKKSPEEGDEKKPKSRAKAEKKIADENQQEEKKAKRKPAKTSQSEPKPKKAPRKNKAKEEVEVVPLVKDLVIRCLKECESSHCVHPNFEHPKTDVSSIMPYWSRKAAGVTIPKELSKSTRKQKEGKIAKSKRSQVAYFSGETPCIYSNILLAGIFVSCLKVVNAMEWMYM